MIPHSVPTPNLARHRCAPTECSTKPQKRNHGLPHDPYNAIVGPRPIGWITSMSAKGEINLAPYSFFNSVSSAPPMVMFASDGRKDTIDFVEQTGLAKGGGGAAGGGASYRLSQRWDNARRGARVYPGLSPRPCRNWLCRAGTWRSSTGRRRVKSIDCLRSRPTW